MAMFAVIFYLVVAALCALLAERLVPDVIPGGFITAAIIGVLGGWLGGNLMGNFGPDLAGVSLAPCVLGSALLVFGLALASKGYRHARS